MSVPPRPASPGAVLPARPPALSKGNSSTRDLLPGSVRQVSRSPEPRKNSPRGYATLKKGTIPDGYRPPMNCSGIVSRFTGGLSRWKEKEMSLDSTSAGLLSIAEGPTLVLFSDRRSAVVDVLWAFEEKGGQKLQFTVTDVNHVKELFQVASAPELDKWLQALQSHNCVINKPIKMNALHLVKEKRDSSWVVLYPESIRYFKHKTDSKPHRIVNISEGAVLDRIDEESFCLSETGDDQANSISLVMLEDCRDFYDAIEQAVNLKSQNKFSDSILEGYVWMCEKGGSSFKKRYCVLYTEGIKYFKKRFDDNPAGFIRLPPGSEVEVISDEASATSSSSSSRKNTFWVAENGDSAGVQRYWISTKTIEERLEWLDALNEVFLSKDTQVQTNSLFEGYLFKRSLNGIWKKNFFVLLQDFLTYSPRRNDTERKQIDLNQGMQLIALNPNPNDSSMNRPGLIALAENGDEGTRTYVLAAVSDASRAEWLDILITLLSTKDPRVNTKSYKEGYMRMQGKSKTSDWRKRYFILLDRSLLYYKKRNEQECAGEIKISAAAEVVELEEGNSDNRFQFSVSETGDEQSPVFYFSCPSVDVRVQWMNAIMKRAKVQDSRVVPNSILEGYLWIVKGNASEKRYFILTQTMLLYFKKRADKQEAGSFEIKGEAEISILTDEEHPYSFSIAKSGDAGEKKLVLFARDVETRYTWVSHLRYQVSLLAVKESVTSIREGYVYVLNGSTWRKRYFILERDPVACLNLFAKRKDVKPVRKIVLDKDTVVMLLDNNNTTHSSNNNSFDVSSKESASFTAADEVDEVGVGGEEEEKDRKIASMEMLLCRNGDPGSKRLHLKGANESEALLVADLMEVCLRKEFPPSNDLVLKSGYVAGCQESGLLKASRWLPSFLVLSSERLTVYKSCADELPLAIVALDEGVKISYVAAATTTTATTTTTTTTTTTVHIVDRNMREVNLAPQSDDEKKDWIGAINHIIMASKSNEVNQITRTDLFGAPLKVSFTIRSSPFYQLPLVIVSCVEFLKLAPLSGCLFRHPGSQALVRGFIQNFEAGFDPVLRDKDSVSACLRLYLVMLPKPIISENLMTEIADLALNHSTEQKTSSSSSSSSSIEKVQELITTQMDFESKCALTILLYYLDHEIKRPEEVDVTLEHVTQIWARILMRSSSKDETEETNNNNGNSQKKSIVLAFLLRFLKTIFSSGTPVICRKLSPAKLQELKTTVPSLTFEQLFQDAYGLSLFAQFVKENYLDENFLFLTATRRYRDICTSSQYTFQQRHAAALQIINMHIKQGAEKQCNLSASLSTDIQTRFGHEEMKKTLNGNEFAEAEAEVILLEATNSYPRFQKTQAYDQWLSYRYSMEQQAGANKTMTTFRRSTLTARLDSDPPAPPTEIKTMAHDLKITGRRGFSRGRSAVKSREGVVISPTAKGPALSSPRGLANSKPK